MCVHRTIRDVSSGRPGVSIFLLALIATLLVSPGCSERRKEAARLEAELVAARSRGPEETTQTDTQTDVAGEDGAGGEFTGNDTDTSSAPSGEQSSESHSATSPTDRINDSNSSAETSFVRETLDQILTDSATSQSAVSTPVVSQRPREGYTVQIAGTPSADEAAAIVERFKLYGYDAYTAEVSRNGRPFYRVRVGRFETEQEAMQLKAQLAEQQQIEGWVDQGTWQ